MTRIIDFLAFPETGFSGKIWKRLQLDLRAFLGLVNGVIPATTKHDF